MMPNDNNTPQKSQAQQPEVMELRFPCNAKHVKISRLLAAEIASQMEFTYDEIEEIKNGKRKTENGKTEGAVARRCER